MAAALAIAGTFVVALTGCVSPHSGLTPGEHGPSFFPETSPSAYPTLAPVRWRPARPDFLRPEAGWRWAALDRSWRGIVKSHVVPLSRRVSLVPLDLTGDGGFVANMHSPEYSGVVKVEPGGGAYTPIRAFDDPENDQAVGSSDGRYTVWYQYHSDYDFADFEVFAWDSTTGLVSQVGAAVPAPDGGHWPSSWRRPEVDDGRVTWTQGVGPDSLSDVHVLDLASRRDAVVCRGRAGESFFFGQDAVAWTESAGAEAPPRFSAAAADSGRELPVPRALRSLRGAPGIATDGRAIAYSDPHWQSVWWSPQTGVAPRRALTSPRGRHVVNSLQVSGRYIAFSVAPHTYLADMRTRRYFEIGAGGWVLLDDEYLLMMMPSLHKATHGLYDLVLVPLSELPFVGDGE